MPPAPSAGASTSGIALQSGAHPNLSGQHLYQPADMVRLLRTAQDMSLQNWQLRALHHLHNSAETFRRALAYYAAKGSIRAATNQRYAARLDFVIRALRQGEGFETARAQAWARFPR